MPRTLIAILVSAWLVAASPAVADPSDVVAIARGAIGRPYAWGATGPDRFDCSGLVVWSYAQAGIVVPRTSQQQSVAGTAVARADLEPGDIVIYYRNASHVGIYTGGGEVIHASTYGRPVAEVPIDAAGPYRNARRLLPRRSDTMTLFYPDVSNNNWRTTQDAINFLSRLAGEGFDAVCHKVTEGSGYRDPYWPAVRDWCKANDMLLVGYHYVRVGDPTGQARLYRDHVGDTSIPCMLDFEANSGDIANFWAVADAFNAAGVQIALSYLPHWYWEQIGRPNLTGVPGLVASAYPGGNGYASTVYEFGGGSQGSGWAPYGGIYPAVWQFTDKATVAGIPVDANAFRGSLADFKQLLGINTGGTVPAPSNDDQLNYIYGQMQPYPQLAGKPDALAELRQKIADGVDLTLVDAFAAHIHGLFTDGN